MSAAEYLTKDENSSIPESYEVVEVGKLLEKHKSTSSPDNFL